MRVRATTILADAWGLWRADWGVLTAVAGVFVALPALAYNLFVPAPPGMAGPASGAPDDAALRAFVAATQDWIAQYGICYIALAAAVLFAQFALAALYLAPRRPTAGEALASAATVFWRMLVASLAWALPVGLVTLLLMQIGLTVAALPVTALALARTCLIGPALLAERPIGALAALVRSVRLTRGHMLMLASLLLGVMIAQAVLATPFALADDWLKAHGPNPVVRVMIDAAAAGITMLSAVAVALIEVAAWRRLGAPVPARPR